MRPSAIFNAFNPFNIVYKNHEFSPLGPGSVFAPTPAHTAPLVVPGSQCGTVHPANIYTHGPNYNDVEANTSDESENAESSSDSGEELDESRIAGGQAGTEDDIESYYEDAGSVASGEDDFDEAENATSAAVAEAPKPNNHGDASSRRTHSQYHPPQEHLPSQHFASPPQNTLPNASSGRGDCSKCDEPNEWDNMIQCDNTKRHGEDKGWYHYSCGGIANMYYVAKADDKWLCEVCLTEDLSDDPNKHFEYTDSDDESVGDERRKPNKERMVTGVQDPEARRQARKAKREAAASKKEAGRRDLKPKSCDDDENGTSNNNLITDGGRKRRPAPASALDSDLQQGARGHKRRVRDPENEVFDEQPSRRKRQKSESEVSEDESNIGRRPRRRVAPAPEFDYVSEPEDGTKGRKRKIRDLTPEDESSVKRPRWWDPDSRS
ncbi:hypothetical protein P7C71_g2511, partial [Lecanoromycetidae sp. Uapishka_2]